MFWAQSIGMFYVMCILKPTHQPKCNTWKYKPMNDAIMFTSAHWDQLEEVKKQNFEFRADRLILI